MKFRFNFFGRWCAKQIKKDDIVVAWGISALPIIRRAKKLGIITVLERGSSHVLYQTKIMKEECEKYNLEVTLNSQELIERELREYEEADYISIPSLFVKRTFLEQGIPEQKLIQVPYGVELSHFKQVVKKDSIFRIIHCGGITLRKGVHYLLQAFYELNLPDVELWLIGGMSDEIKPFLKKYDNGKVFHKGPFPQRELYKYYSQGSVFVMMSIEDGFGIVIPQAMACGLPAICSSNTGGEDIMRNGKDGFIIPIRNVEILKEKLLYFYKNPVICKRMGKSAKKRVSQGFTWDDYGRKMIVEYRKVLDKI